jgi:hypothetical protein
MVETIQELSALAKKLNQKSDGINVSISTINAKLAKLNIGLEVWLGSGWSIDALKTDDWEEVNPNETNMLPRKRNFASLGYDIVEDAWQLTVKFATETQHWDDDVRDVTTDISDVQYVPLLKASRELRIAALPLVPRLLDAIKARAEAVLNDIEAAAKAAEEL